MVFDDPNLVSAAGLVPVMRLGEAAGLHELLDEHLSVASPNPVVKSASVIAGMLAGADSIDDLDVLRHGGMRRCFAGVRAPSTLGSYLRSFRHGHVQQLDAVASRLLAGLAARVPGLLAGGDTVSFVDIDDTIREVHGYAKQAAAFGYSGVRGLNAQLAVVSTPLAAPVIAAARLRKGNTASGKGAGRLLAQAVATARRAGVSGRLLVRADSAYYAHATVAAALRAKAWFSITARMNPQVVAAISRIPEDAWKTIEYPNAVWDEDERRWVSEAEVAEIAFTAFTSRRKADQVACRLVVRRVKRLNTTGHGGQGDCSPRTAITRSSRTRRCPPWRPTPATATTPSSSRSSPSSRPARWRTYPPAPMPPMPPGWRTRSSRSTWPAPPACSPPPATHGHGGRRCAPS